MIYKYVKLSLKTSYTLYVGSTLEELYVSLVQFIFTFHLIVPFVWYNLIFFAYIILSGFIVADVKIIQKPKNRIDVINPDSITDFGKIKYILSDKTGTLSSRRFILKACMFPNKIYSFEPLEKNDENYIFKMKNFDMTELDLYNDLKNDSEYSEMIKELFEYLCLCHNVNAKITTSKKNVRSNINGDNEVIRESTTSEKKFNSSVAEEKAMLKTLKKFGYIVDQCNNKEITLLINGEKKHYYVLGQNRYTEERNRMSVIIKAHKMDKGNILYK